MVGGNLPTRPTDPVAGSAPTTKEVEKFHTNADTDGSDGSVHHTLGPRKGQSAPGDHDHRGGNSKLLLEGVTITGSDATPLTIINSIVDALVELGATDNTTV